MNAHIAVLTLLEQTDQYVCFSSPSHTNQLEWLVRVTHRKRTTS